MKASPAECATWKFRFVKVNQSVLANCHRFSKSLAPKVESGGNYILNKQRESCKLVTNPESHCLQPCQSKFSGIRATASGCHTFFSKSKHFVDCLKTFERSILVSIPISLSFPRSPASFVVFHFCLLHLFSDAEPFLPKANNTRSLFRHLSGSWQAGRRLWYNTQQKGREEKMSTFVSETFQESSAF